MQLPLPKKAEIPAEKRTTCACCAEEAEDAARWVFVESGMRREGPLRSKHALWLEILLNFFLPVQANVTRLVSKEDRVPEKIHAAPVCADCVRRETDAIRSKRGRRLALSALLLVAGLCGICAAILALVNELWPFSGALAGIAFFVVLFGMIGGMVSLAYGHWAFREATKDADRLMTEHAAADLAARVKAEHWNSVKAGPNAGAQQEMFYVFPISSPKKE